jgi:hypothetical protein
MATFSPKIGQTRQIVRSPNSVGNLVPGHELLRQGVKLSAQARIALFYRAGYVYNFKFGYETYICRYALWENGKQIQQKN